MSVCDREAVSPEPTAPSPGVLKRCILNNWVSLFGFLNDQLVIGVNSLKCFFLV